MSLATFKTRARALDMLGRQQIAGIPTAISELFKNAHDAYATKVEVDYYRWNRLFILRDDGIGMTREEFENRWLTLGTDSKIGKNLIQPPLSRGEARPVMGEKGIGRLAIGSIGPQVLVLTRAERFGDNPPLIAAFINWSAFSIPGVNLDQIEIPIKEFPSGLPTAKDVQTMKSEFARALKKAHRLDQSEAFERVLAEIEQFDVDPHERAKALGSPTLSEGAFGTHFYIHPADEQLQAVLDERAARAGRGGGSADSGNLEKFLIGFCNTMTHGHAEPVLTAQFRDHKHTDSFEELIGSERFWSPEDVDAADHWIRGEFDEFGQFKGTICIFGETQPDHVIPFDARGQRLTAGPFKIEVAVMQGKVSESRATPEKYAEFQKKLDRFAGVYVYRDNLRVLPYGNNDYDWLDIEKRRTKSAGYYFFSYRNMFGAILLTREKNAALVEKAGREGFQENRAYRQIRDVLANFFVQIAADFLREDAEVSSRAQEVRTAFKKAYEAKKNRDVLVTVQRARLAEELEQFFKSNPRIAAEEAAEDVRRQIRIIAETAASQPNDHSAIEALLQAEIRAHEIVDQLRDQYRVAKRRGLVLKGRLKDNFERYESEFEVIDGAIIAPLYFEVTAAISNAAKHRAVDLDQRRRVELAIEQVDNELTTQAKEVAREIRKLVKEAQESVEALTTSKLSELERVSREVKSKLASSGFSQLPDEKAVEIKDDLESSLRRAQTSSVQVLEDLRHQLTHLQLSPTTDGELVTQEDLREALELQLADLEDRIDADVELAQMGMAIEVINHEFEQSVKAIRENLRRLKSWGDVNPKLGSVYRDLSASFQHLDSYLRLFTPLHRRLYREPVKITGREIFQYLRDIFRRRSEETGVEIKARRRFLEHTLVGYPSTFYPVFVNLVDNAVFWTKDVQGVKEIVLDLQEGALVVSDTGPGIAFRDRERIFDRGFTRKPMGRGLGLYVCKEALAEAGFTLQLDTSDEVKGTSFLIRPAGEQDNDV